MEDDDKELLEEFSSKVDDTFAIINAIKIISQISEFEKWLKDKHRKKSDLQVFYGYRFFTETLIRTLFHSIIYGSELPVDEDFIFSRARFAGVELSKIPNTCEKTIFLKNLNRYRRSIKNAKNWKELQESINKFQDDFINKFEKIFEKNIEGSPKLKIGRQEALKYTTIFYVYIYLNDTSRFIPHGYFVSVLKNGLEKNYRKITFEGYKFALQFVWHQLLGEKSYNKTSIRHLHKSPDWSKELEIPTSSGEIIDFSEIEWGSSDEEIESPVERDDLDSYFSKIKDEIITPLEEKLGMNFGFSKFFRVKNIISKKEIGDLLKYDKKIQLNEKEKLDYKLLWYQIEFLDSSKSSIFNGVPTFIQLLIGSAESKRIFGIDEKAYICKFVHPDKSVNGNDFSYGVLIEAFGSSGISDYSGWLLFYDCCGDYSGFSGSEHMMAEKTIELYEKKGLIEVRKMTIDKQKFKEYIADKIVSDKKEDILEELDRISNKRLEGNIVNEAKGLVLELLCYYTLTNKDSCKNVDWSVKRDGKELDITYETDDELILVECKTDPNTINLNEHIQKLEKKIKSYDSQKSKRGEFWFWYRPNPNRINLLKNKKIEFIVFSELIEDNPLWKNKNRNKIKFIFKKLADYNLPVL